MGVVDLNISIIRYTTFNPLIRKSSYSSVALLIALQSPEIKLHLTLQKLIINCNKLTSQSSLYILSSNIEGNFDPNIKFKIFDEHVKKFSITLEASILIFLQ